MIIPVRCFTCNSVIGQKWKQYSEKVDDYINDGVTEKDARCTALDEVGLKRYCCRRMFLGHVNVIDDLLKFNPKHTPERTEPLPDDYKDPIPTSESESEKDYNYIEPESEEESEYED